MEVLSDIAMNAKGEARKYEAVEKLLREAWSSQSPALVMMPDVSEAPLKEQESAEELEAVQEAKVEIEGGSAGDDDETQKAEAAIKIQSVARGKSERRARRKRNKAATKIQARHRGRRARKRASKRKR